MSDQDRTAELLRMMGLPPKGTPKETPTPARPTAPATPAIPAVPQREDPDAFLKEYKMQNKHTETLKKLGVLPPETEPSYTSPHPIPRHEDTPVTPMLEPAMSGDGGRSLSQGMEPTSAPSPLGMQSAIDAEERSRWFPTLFDAEERSRLFPILSDADDFRKGITRSFVEKVYKPLTLPFETLQKKAIEFPKPVQSAVNAAATAAYFVEEVGAAALEKIPEYYLFGKILAPVMPFIGKLASKVPYLKEIWTTPMGKDFVKRVYENSPRSVKLMVKSAFESGNPDEVWKLISDPKSKFRKVVNDFLNKNKANREYKNLYKEAWHKYHPDRQQYQQRLALPAPSKEPTGISVPPAHAGAYPIAPSPAVPTELPVAGALAVGPAVPAVPATTASITPPALSIKPAPPPTTASITPPAVAPSEAKQAVTMEKIMRKEYSDEKKALGELKRQELKALEHQELDSTTRDDISILEQSLGETAREVSKSSEAALKELGITKKLSKLFTPDEHMALWRKYGEKSFDMAEKLSAKVTQLKDAGEFRKQMTALAREFLPPNLREKVLIPLSKELTTEKTRGNVAASFNKALIEMQKSKALDGLKKEFGNAKGALKKYGEVKLVEIDKILKEFSVRKRTEKTLSALLEKSHEMQALYEKDGLSLYKEEAEKAILEYSKKPIADLTVPEIKDLTENIAGIIHRAKQASVVKIEGKNLELDVVREAMEAGLKKTEVSAGKGVSTSKSTKPSTGTGAKFYSPYKLSGKLKTLATDAGKEARRLFKGAMESLTHSASNAVGAVQRIEAAVKTVSEWLPKGGQKPFSTIIASVDGTKLQLTKEEACALYLSLQDTDHTRRILGGGFAFSNLHPLKKFSSGELGRFLKAFEKDNESMSMMQAMRKMINNEGYEVSKKYYDFVTGKELPFGENYYQIESPTKGPPGQPHPPSITGLSFKNPRVETEQGVILQPLGRVLENYLTRARSSEMVESIGDMRKFLGNSGIKNAMIESNGTKYYKELVDYVNDLEKWALGTETKVFGEGKLDQLLKVFLRSTTGYLSFANTLPVIAKQVSSIPTAIAGGYLTLKDFSRGFGQLLKMSYEDFKSLSPKEIAKALFDSEKNISSVVKELEELSPLAKLRFKTDGFLSELAAEAMRSGSKDALKSTMKLQEVFISKGMTGIRLTDKATICALYLGMKERAVRELWDAKQLRYEFEEMMEVSQPTNNSFSLPDFWRKRGLLGRMLLPFQSAIRGVHNVTLGATQDYLNNEISGKEFIKRMLYISAGVGGVIGGADKLLGKKREEEEPTATWEQHDKRQARENALLVLRIVQHVPHFGTLPGVSLGLGTIRGGLYGRTPTESLFAASRDVNNLFEFFGVMFESAMGTMEPDKAKEASFKIFKSFLRWYTAGFSKLLEPAEREEVDKTTQEALKRMREKHTEGE